MTTCCLVTMATNCLVTMATSCLGQQATSQVTESYPGLDDKSHGTCPDLTRLHYFTINADVTQSLVTKGKLMFLLYIITELQLEHCKELSREYVSHTTMLALRYLCSGPVMGPLLCFTASNLQVIGNGGGSKTTSPSTMITDMNRK